MQGLALTLEADRVGVWRQVEEEVDGGLVFGALKLAWNALKSADADTEKGWFAACAPFREPAQLFPLLSVPILDSKVM